MRIAINGAFWGKETTGSGQYLMALLPEMARLAPDDAFSLVVPGSLGVPTPAGNLPWSVHRVPTPLDGTSENLAKVWFEQVTFPGACRRMAADVAHVPYFAPPLRSPVPVVVTVHDLVPLLLPEYRRAVQHRLYMRLVSAGARRAALVLTDSHASARDIAQVLEIPPERIRVIHLAAHPRYRPQTPAECRPVVDRLKLPSRYLLYLGGFDRRKNVPALLRAMVRARFRLEGARLAVGGVLPERDTPFTPDPRRIVHELGIEDVVQFLGHVSEEHKPALYAGALAFAFPSSYEGFGLPPLEAISCGTPAIVGQGSALEEVVGPGGISVPGGDVEALAEALVTLTSDGHRRAELSRAGLRQAARFSWERTARETVQAYRDVAGGH
jgi:glycosyltransferase involved in cell wall biosynthesis